MNSQNELALQIRKDDSTFLTTCDANKELGHSILQTSSFDGISEVITVLVSLTTFSLPIIVSLLKEQIRARKYVKIVFKGVQIQGIDEKNVDKVLTALLKNERK